MDQIHKPRFKMDPIKKMSVLKEVLEYENKWEKRKKRRESFLKSIHVGLTVCLSAVFLFLIGKYVYFHDWTPQKKIEQTAQKVEKTTKTEKTKWDQDMFKLDGIEPTKTMPFYDRINDVKVTNGVVTVTAIGGALQEKNGTKKKGVLIVYFYSGKNPLGNDSYVTDQRHGPLKVYQDGTSVRVVAEDGKEWRLQFSGSETQVSYSVN